MGRSALSSITNERKCVGYKIGEAQNCFPKKAKREDPNF